MWLPIHLSALAPAEVTAFNPTIVRAPLDGVVDHFEVKPNEDVKILKVTIKRGAGKAGAKKGKSE